jgi:TRAP-type C4-dicarboxylate transport system substrate-binding protein
MEEKEMKNRVLFLVLALVLISSLTLVGCSTQTTTPAKTSAAPAPTSAAPAPTSAAPAPTSAAPAPTSSTAAPAPAVTYKLKYADQNPDTGWEGAHAAAPWLKQITGATNGAVQFETYYSQTLFKGTDAWTSVKNGVGDLAWMFHGYWANQTPLADVISLPLMPFKSAKQASGIFWKLYEKYPGIRDQFKDNHVLLTFTSQPYFLLTSKKQVKTMADIKGLNIRVTAGPPIDMMKLLGATPVTKGMPDTYLALQKGELDGMLAPWEALLSFKQYEVAKYYTYAPLVTVYFTQAMNNAAWNKLPKPIQDQIDSVSGLKGSEFWGENMFDSAMVAGRDQVKKLGIEMVEYTLPDDEIAKWNTVAGKPLWDAWVKAQVAAGHPEAQEILDTCQSLIKTYNP